MNTFHFSSASLEQYARWKNHFDKAFSELFWLGSQLTKKDLPKVRQLYHKMDTAGRSCSTLRWMLEKKGIDLDKVDWFAVHLPSRLKEIDEAIKGNVDF